MDDEALLHIGMFSRASSLSIKTLRAYHEAGILVPASVDPRTGYRAYHVDQLADATVIVRLRALDLPLVQVREILRRRDPEVTRRVLAGHRLAMERRLAETERIVSELHSGLAPVTHTPVYVRHERARHTVCLRATVSGDDLAEVLGWAFGRLTGLLQECGIVPSGPAGALYRAEIPDDGPEPLEALLPLAAPFELPVGEREVAIGQLPAAETAVLVHAGDYGSIGDTYRTLGAWVARHAAPAAGPIREWYLVGPDESADPAHYRTEISWPVLGRPSGASTQQPTTSRPTTSRPTTSRPTTKGPTT